jgi:AcrR family transcriptional regulator
MPVQVDHEQRRRELAAAVWRVVRRGGVSALSIRAVGKEAGWTSGIVQHYFPTKNDLLRHAFELVQRRTVTRMRETTEEAPPERGLECAMLALLPVDPDIEAEAEVWLAFLGLALGEETLRETAERGANELIDLMTEQVARAQASGAVDPALVDREVATELLSLADGLNVQSLFRRRDLPPETLRALVTRRLAELAPA